MHFVQRSRFPKALEQTTKDAGAMACLGPMDHMRGGEREIQRAMAERDKRRKKTFGRLAAMRLVDGHLGRETGWNRMDPIANHHSWRDRAGFYTGWEKMCVGRGAGQIGRASWRER